MSVSLLFSICLCALLSLVLAAPDPRPQGHQLLFSLLRYSARHIRHPKTSVAFDHSGLELSSLHIPSRKAPRSGKPVRRSGTEVIDALFRAERSRSLPLRRSLPSSPRIRRFSVLLQTYSRTPASFRREEVLKAWPPVERTKYAPDSTGEAVEPSPFVVMDEPTSAGLTGSSCKRNVDCKGKRACVGMDGYCQKAEDCYCIPPTPVLCASTSDCPPGEVCVSSDLFEDEYCVSEQFDETVDEVWEMKAAPRIYPVVVVEPSFGPELEGGLTADPCEADAECQGERMCLSIDTLAECEIPGTCVCAPPAMHHCTTSGQCVPGEACASAVTADDICLSKEFVSDNDDVFEAGVGPSPEVETVNVEMESPSPDFGMSKEGVFPSPETPDTNLFPRGLTGDSCTADKDCKGNRSCLSGKGCCSMMHGCLCAPRNLLECTVSADCAEGELCVQMIEQLFCVSETVVMKGGLEASVVSSFPTPSASPEVS